MVKNSRQLFFLLSFLFPFLVVAQVTTTEEGQDTSKIDEKVVVDHSDLGEYIQADAREIQYLKGNVELRQGNVYMYCDTAVIESNNVNARGEIIIQQGDSLNIFADSLSFKGNEKIADLFGDVVMVNNDQKLFTERLNYDMNTKIAKYFTGATLTDGDRQLTSKKGYYYVDSDVAFFKDSVMIVDPEFELRTDTLKFDTKTKVATFLAPTLITQGESKIYCESGFYDTEQGVAEFTKNAQYQKAEQKATADIIRYDGTKKEVTLTGNALFIDGTKQATADQIRYDEANDITYLEGNAHFQDGDQDIKSDVIKYDAKADVFTTDGRSKIVDQAQILEADRVDYDSEGGMGRAFGNVVWVDTTSNIRIECEQADYNKETDYLMATGGRPFMTALIDLDTFYMTSDTLVSERKSEDDSTRILYAYRDVRILKSDLQAICDSLVYSAADSIFEFYENPIIWSDTSQFSADTVRMRLDSGKIDKILMNQNAFIINTTDEFYYNQIKGKDITAFFEENELRRMHVEGNAESVYYAQDDYRAYIGVNKTVCSEMLLYFGNNKVDRIKFMTAPKGSMLPMGQTNHNTLRMPGFRWETERRPRTLDDLFKTIDKKEKPPKEEEEIDEKQKEDTESKETGGKG